MVELEPDFRQLHRKGEYPRLEDMGLIGDGTTAALVSLDGSIPWLCLPRFDSEPVFCGLLDVARGVTRTRPFVVRNSVCKTAVISSWLPRTSSRQPGASSVKICTGADGHRICGRTGTVRRCSGRLCPAAGGTRATRRWICSTNSWRTPHTTLAPPIAEPAPAREPAARVAAHVASSPRRR